MGLQGRMGLPQHVREVALLRAPDQADGRFYAVVRPDADEKSFNAEVLDTNGNCYLRLKGYQTVALAGGINADSLKNLQATMSAEAVLVA
jgi:hypothetical protein